MVDVSTLSPSDLAAHLRCPTGDVGVAVGEFMNRTNSRVTQAVYDLLSPAPNAHILEIGFGNGRFIADLLAVSPGITYAGVDASETMVAAARAESDSAIREGRVELHLGSVDRLPFSSATFDGALAVNTVYFWPDLANGLRELRRVLRPEAALIVASLTPETSLKLRSARPEYGFRILDVDDLLSAHHEAGFGNVRCESYEENTVGVDGSVIHRAYNLLVARS